jgi:hypothetical protein
VRFELVVVRLLDVLVLGRALLFALAAMAMEDE